MRLLFGVAVLGVGHGALMTAVSVRVDAAGPPALTTAVLTAYALGLLVGAMAGPAVSARIGARPALVGAAAALSLHSAALGALEPGLGWVAIRFAGGAAAAVLFVGIEATLARRAGEHRGALLGAYVLLLQLGWTVGQLLLSWLEHLGAPTCPIFALAYACFAVVAGVEPSALALRPAAAPAPLWALVGRAPTALLGCAVAGVVSGLLIYLGPVYATHVRLPSPAIFMSWVLGGGMVLAVPLGRIADRTDRASMLVWVAGLLTLAAAVMAALGASGGWAPLMAAALVGGLSFAFYPLAIALGSERLGATESVAALFVSVFAVGSITAPSVGSLAMAALGPLGLPISIAAIALVVPATAMVASHAGTTRARLRRSAPA